MKALQDYGISVEVSVCLPPRVYNRGGERVSYLQYTALKLKMQSHMTIHAYV